MIEPILDRVTQLEQEAKQTAETLHIMMLNETELLKKYNLIDKLLAKIRDRHLKLKRGIRNAE